LNLCKFYISVGYSDEVKGCRLWDPTAHKIISSRDMYMEQLVVFQDCKGIFVCKLRESLYGLKVPRKWSKMFDPFMVSQKFLRSDYNQCVYFESLENGTIIFLVLYADDMFVASQIMFKISKFSMYIVKPVDIHLALYCNLSSSLCHDSKEENDNLSRVPYANTIGKLMFAMKCSRLDISHVVGVVNGHMENPETCLKLRLARMQGSIG
jgi:hypothetical protein